MKGAIIGDIIGSAYEFNNIDTKDFPLFSDRCCFTDDTVMTCAVAKVLTESEGRYDRITYDKIVKTFRDTGRGHPDAGYGARFIQWLFSDRPLPYNSCGNGSAMRISAAGFAAHSLEEAKDLARIFSEVSHNHPEGIKGAECTAVCIFLARNHWTKAEIKQYVEENYYTLDKTCEDYRREQAGQHGKELCPISVPQALTCFIHSCDFEDCIRNCISIGGDSDTIAAIAGGIAEAYYGVPEKLWISAKQYLTDDLLQIVESFLSRPEACSLLGIRSYEAFLVYDADEEKRKTFTGWLKLQGFKCSKYAVSRPAPWLYINLTEKKYNCGVYGCSLISSVCNTAISGAEFQEIYRIYQRNQNKGPMVDRKDDYSLVDEAIVFASKAHAGAFRKGTDIPYIVHPMEVFKIVCGLTEDENVRIAAILHDTVEDTGTSIDEIRCIFGKKVAQLVGSESENKREGTPEQDTWKLRKSETIERLKTASKEIRTIAMGDKLANLRDISRDYRMLEEQLWERFNAPENKKESIGWYYSSVLEALKPDFEHTPEYEEYSELLKMTF